jgi:ABC-type uncharacterized transport system permease subunit
MAAAMYCSMGFAGYVSVCVQLYCVGFHSLSLHVSVYMAIFKRIGYFYFHIPEGFYVAADGTNNKERASRQTHTQETTKINEGKQHRKNTNGNAQSVTT